MKRLLALVLALLIALAANIALAETIAEDSSDSDELVVGTTTAMTGNFFTDLWGSSTSDADVQYLLHGYNLVEWNSDTGAYGVDASVVSGLVVTDDSDGNRTYTVAIYDDLYYSDGTAITAWDYAFSILFSISPEAAEIGAATTSADYILGADEYLAGEADRLSGVRVLSETQLAITVKAEYLPFFYELALLDCTPYPISVIAPGCEVADDGDGVYILSPEDGEAFSAEMLTETVLDSETGYLSHPSVTSGPYKLVSYDAENGVAEFEINEYYKGNSDGETPSISRIVYKYVASDEVASALESGEIGLMNKCVYADTIDAGLELVSTGDLDVTDYARSGFSFISFNCERTSVQSAAVRQAIACCFDKDAFIEEYVGDYGERVDGYYGIGQWMVALITGETALEEPDEDADEETIAEYEDALARLESLSLSGVTVYNLDTDLAVSLLESDGWTLNRDGEAFDPETDDVRCKEIDGELVALELKIIYPEGNEVGATLEGSFADNLKSVGISLEVESVPFAELLSIYYRQQERDCDMIYLATNFAKVFDPAETFSPEDAYQGVDNRTGIADEELYDLAVDMRETEPGDVVTYLEKWVAFQERFAEVLPVIPVYSNVYYDFYTTALQNYNIEANVSWAQAIVGAYLIDTAE